MTKYGLFAVMLAVLSCTNISYGSITVEAGPDSVLGHPTGDQPSWPIGIVELPRHESRVLSLEEGGQWNFYFKASPAQISELILLFSKTRIRDHELWIKERKQQESFYRIKTDYNMCLVIHAQNPLAEPRGDEPASTHEPTLTIYLDLPADQGLAKEITLPDNIIVHNEIADFPLTGKAAAPKRKFWYARVLFDDSTPAADFKHSAYTRVTLWEQGIKEGIRLGRVNNEGYFHTALSEKEINDLKSGKSWLTLTVGNWLTEVKSDHPRVSWESLSLEKEKASPVTVAGPKFFYGRILYEDGVPVNKTPWVWNKILVSFPYVGNVQVEIDGYFKVCYTGDQYETAKTMKQRRNIHIANNNDWNKSLGQLVFPVSKLSFDKEKAGVVRIPRRGSE